MDRSVALLTFARNDVDAVIDLIEGLRGDVDGCVVIDSSYPEQRAKLLRALREPHERLHEAPPVGDVDLLRPYGLSKAESDWVLLLESDEAPSPGLRARLHDLGNVNGYIIPRYERSARGYTYHLRLFSRTAATYSGPSHAYPVIRGPTGRLPREEHIEHRAPSGAEFWSSADRARRYLLPDTLERPYDVSYLRNTFGLGPGTLATYRSGGLPAPLRPLPDPMVRVMLAAEAVREILTTGSGGLARSRWEQGKARRQYWAALPSPERARLAAWAARVREEGGLTRFLGFDRPEYVARLSTLLPATLDGPSVLRALVEYRAGSGRPWDGGDDLPLLPEYRTPRA